MKSDIFSLRFVMRQAATPPAMLLLGFIVAIYPLVVVPHPWGTDFTIMDWTVAVPPSYFYAPRYFLLALAAGVALVLLFRLAPEARGRRWELVPLVAFLFFGMIATSLAAFPQTAWFGTPMRWTGFTTDLYCVVLFLLAWHALNRRQVETLIYWLVGAAALVGGLAILQYYGLNLVPHQEFRANFISFGTMANPNFLGTYMVFALPAAMLVFLYYRRSLPWLLAAALIYGGLLASLTRGVWLAGLLVFLALAGYVYWRTRKEPPSHTPAVDGKMPVGYLNCKLGQFSVLRAFLVLSLVFILVTAMLAPARDGRLLGKAATVPGEIVSAVQMDPYAGAQRVFIWRETLRLWLVNPGTTLFGIGPDHLIYIKIITPGGSLVDKAHNIYLERAVTQGAGALLAYLVFLGAVLYRLPSRGGRLGVLLSFMIAAYMLQGLFNIEVIMTQPLFWIVLGMAMAVKNKEN